MHSKKIIITLSILLAFMVAGVSLIGILTPDFYMRETSNWQVQSIGQDIIDLAVVVPALLLSTQIILRTRRVGLFLWAGVLLYLIYTFAIFAFDIHFNKLFFVYCLILGLSFYLFIYFLFSQTVDPARITSKKITNRVIGIYFIVMAALFYLLWLLEVIPYSIAGKTPVSLMEVGTPTNPVHVLDLSVILPGIFLVGVLLLKNRKMGHALTPAILIFFTLMDITIGTLSLMMRQKGFQGSLQLTVVMGGLALLSFCLLVWYFRNQNLVTS